MRNAEDQEKNSGVADIANTRFCRLIIAYKEPESGMGGVMPICENKIVFFEPYI